MGRLIDADVNRDEFMEEVYDILSDEPDNIKANLIIDAFDEIQTAYDPDKVVEQLEKLKSLVPVNRVLDDIVNDKPKELGMLIAYEKAIKIVKGGGVDGN